MTDHDQSPDPPEKKEWRRLSEEVLIVNKGSPAHSEGLEAAAREQLMYVALPSPDSHLAPWVRFHIYFPTPSDL
jgi:hypothetical protein